MNGKVCGRKLPWYNLRYYSGIPLEGLQEISELSVSRPRFELAYPEYNSQALTLKTTYSVITSRGLGLSARYESVGIYEYYGLY
jgi:hypothetical protein